MRVKPNLRSHSFPKSYEAQEELSFFEQLIKSENIDYLIKDIYSSSKYILLSFYRKSLYYTFMISKDTGLYFNFNSLDKQFIPFIKFVDENQLLGVYFPELLPKYKAILKTAYYSILENHSEENNPILIRYKLKQ